MNRLEQDAADALAAHERMTKWRERVQADYARNRDQKIVGTWAPVLGEQEKQEREQQIKAGFLPF